MTIAEQLARAKTDLDDVYEAGYNKGLTDAPPSGDYQDGFEAGKQAEYDAFWNDIQDNGNRDEYSYGFLRWGSEYIRPKYKVIPTVASGASNTFYRCLNLKKIEAQYFDFSQKPYGTGYGQGYNYTFGLCTNLEEIEDIGLTAQSTCEYAFTSDTKLKTIAKLGSNENTIFTGAFGYCSALENITFEGVIGQSISFAQSPLLTVASMDSIYAALKDYTSNPGAYTLTLHANAWARWDAAKPDIVAQYGSMKNYVTTTKGWATS